MDTHGNMARWIRAAVETLGEYAEDYHEAGMHAYAGEFEEARELVGRLHRLPDPTSEDDDGYDESDFEPSPDPDWMNP